MWWHAWVFHFWTVSDNAVHVDITRKSLFSLKFTKNVYNLGDCETSGVVSVVLGDQWPTGRPLEAPLYISLTLSELKLVSVCI